MKHLKRILSAFVVTALLTSTMAPAFAASAFTYEAQALKLHDLGLFEGDSDTTYIPALDRDLKREEGFTMLLRLIGKEDDAAAMTDAEADAVLANFADKAQVSEWAKKIVAYAVKNGLVEGMDATTLAPTDKLKGKMFATLVLRNLGYTVNDNDYSYAAALLAEKGGLTVAEAMLFNDKDLIRDDLVGMAFGSLKAKDVTGKEVIANLVADGTVAIDKAIAAGLMTALPTPAPEALAITSVTSDNLVTVTVNFNKAIDEDSIDDGDFEIDGFVSVDSDNVELSSDAKTATITIDADNFLVNGDEYEVFVSDISDVNGIEANDLTQGFTVVDNEVPQALSIEFVGPTTAEITFSEPIDEERSTAGEVVIDNGTYSAQIVTAFDGDDKVTIEVGTELDAGDHTFKVKGFSDFASHNMAVKTLTQKYESVTTAPSATVTKADQSTVTLKFDRPVTGLEVTNFYHTYSSWHPLEIQDKDGATIDSAEYYDEIVLVFTDAEANDVGNAFDEDDDMPLPVGTVKIGVNAEGDSDNTIEDRWENEINDTALTATVAADDVAPTVTKVTVEAENEIRVYFSEDVNSSDVLDQDNYVIKNGDGDIIDDSDWDIEANAYNEDDDYVTISFDEDLDNGDYTITAEAIADTSVNENKMASVTKDFEVSDISEVNFANVEVTWNDDDKVLYVKYDEEMATSGAGSVLNEDNYRLNGAELDEDVNVTLFTSKIVKMQFPSNQTELEGDVLQIGRVSDKAGNTASGLATPETIGPEVAPTITEIKKIDENKFELTVDQELKSVGSNAVYVDNNVVDGNAYATVKFVNDGDETKITVTVPSVEKSEGTEAPIGYTIGIAANKIKSVTGVYMAGGDLAVAINDGMAAKMVEYDKNEGLANTEDDQIAVYAYNAGGNEFVDRIYIKYSEKLDANTISKYTYTVSGGAVVRAGLVLANGADVAAELTTVIGEGTNFVNEGNWVVLILDEEDELQADDTISVTQALEIEDAAGNQLGAQSAQKAMSAEDVVVALN